MLAAVGSSGRAATLDALGGSRAGGGLMTNYTEPSVLGVISTTSQRETTRPPPPNSWRGIHLIPGSLPSIG